MVIYEKIGERIKEARENKGMKAKELAQALDMSAQIVSHWENGKRIPPFETAQLLADELGVTVGYLYCIDEPDNKIEALNVKFADAFEMDPLASKKKLPIPSSLLKKDSEYLAVQISENLGDIFRKNDIALINLKQLPQHNSYVLAKIMATEQVVFRKYVIDSSNIKNPVIKLVALDNENDSIEFDPDFISIIGTCSDNQRIIV